MSIGQREARARLKGWVAMLQTVESPDERTRDAAPIRARTCPVKGQNQPSDSLADVRLRHSVTSFTQLRSAGRLATARTASVTVSVNGTAYQRVVEPRLLLSDFLRHDLQLTG